MGTEETGRWDDSVPGCQDPLILVGEDNYQGTLCGGDQRDSLES